MFRLSPRSLTRTIPLRHHLKRRDSLRPDSFRPMLAEAIASSSLPRFAEASDWFFEQKLDGIRRLVRLDEGTVVAFNRSGEEAALPKDVAAALHRVGGGPWLF